MRKVYFFLVMTLFASALSAQNLIWNFSSGTATPSTNTTSNLVVSDVSQGNNNGTTTMLTTAVASSGYTGASGSYNAGAAARTGAINTGASGSAYFELTLTPDPGFTVTLNTISFGSRSTSTGPQAVSIRSSLDSYGSEYGQSSLANSSTWTLLSPTLTPIQSAAGTPVIIRIYGYNGTGTGGLNTANWRIDDLSLSVTVSSGAALPAITISSSSLSGFTSFASQPSSEQSYTVSGTNLLDDIVITPPTGFEISTTSGSGFVANPSTITLPHSAGTVAATTIYVRMNSASLGSNAGSILNASTSASDRNVAVGGTVLAAEPTTQGAISFGSITGSSVDVNLTSGDGVSRILIVKQGSPVDASPADATTYTADANFGSGSQLGAGNYVVFAGSSSSVTVSSLVAGVTYYFALYEYNDGGTAGAENYLVSSPATANASTPITVTTYTWTNGGGDNVWTNSANWLPTRTIPDPSDILQFNDGGSYLITGLQTETVRQFFVSNNTQVELQAASVSTLTISGGFGVDLDVQTGSQLNVSGTNALQISMPTTVTASIGGSMNMSGAAHRLLAVDASSVTFGSGSSFTAGTGFNGSPFGSTGLNSVIFANGSTYIQQGGANPFGAGQPNSVVIFQTGSLYRILTNLAPSFSGRTYSNLEIDYPTFNVGSTGGATVNIDNLTMLQGSLNLNLTGTINIKGNVSVAPGASLIFGTSNAGTVVFNGTAAQTIANSGTFAFGTQKNLSIDNAAGVDLNTDLVIGTAATLTLTNGVLRIGNSHLSATTVSGGSTNSYIRTNGTGTMTLSNITVAGKLIPVGNSTYNPITIANGSGHDWAVNVEDNLLVTDPVFSANVNQAVQRTWNITPSVNPLATGADITFQYDDADAAQVGGSFDKNANVQAWHKVGSNWIAAGGSQSPTGTANGVRTVTISNWDRFSPFAISNTAAPLPVSFGAIKASQLSSGNIKVDWTNFTELDVVNYSIEHSVDGHNFSPIGTVDARLNNGGKADYSFIDANPATGVNFYRIKSLESAGRAKYSIIVKVDIRAGASQIVIYPNPATGGQLGFQLVNLAKGKYTMRIANAAGQLMYHYSFDHAGGSVTESIPLPSSVSTGTYTLQLIGSENTITKMFVVQ